MAGRVARGVSWMLVNTVMSKGVAFAAQIALGYLLSEEDFGVFALALTVAAFIQILRDGGVSQLLVQRGAANYEQLSGPIFSIALCFNLLAAALLVGAAPLAGHVYSEPRLPPLLLVIALAMPLGTPATVLAAKLQIDLRFGLLARMWIGSALIRSLGAVALAWAGFGPMSFVIPIPVVALFESIVTFAATRHAPWKRPAMVSTWPSLLGQIKWLLLVALASASLNFGDYLIIGMLVPTAVVGVYYFAYNLVIQIGVMLAFNLQQVLFPTLAKLKDEPARQAEAALRALRLLTLLGGPATIGLAVVIEPLERMIWGGKWAQAVHTTQLLALLFVGRIAYSVPAAMLQSRGLFKLNAILILASGLGLVAAAGLGAWLGQTAEWIATAVGAYLGVGCLVCASISFRVIGVSAQRTVISVVRPWLVAVGAGAAAYGFDLALAADWPSFARFLVVGAVFAMCYTLGARLFLAPDLADLLGLGPKRITAPIRTVLRL